jgi:hypothetical protein
VSVTGSTASVNSAGETLIFASQAGDATYAAVTFERHQLVNKAVATVTLSDLIHTYTGSEIAATVTTVPAGLSLKVTYNGLPDLPVDVGTYTVLAEISDVNYVGSATDILSISDLTAPVPDLATLPDLTDECSLTPAAPTATDFNAGSVTGTTPIPFPITTQGTTVITWSYDDGNGNISSQNQTVVIDDVSNPVIPSLADVSGECSATAVAPTTTDACTGIITGTTSDPLTYSIVGTHMITWTFDDGNGNDVQVTQNVIVNDVTPPTATAPADVTTCNGTVAFIGLTDVNDNCAIPIVTYELSGATTGTGSGDDASVNMFNPGVTTVSYTLDDGNGNSSQYSFTVSYQLVDDIVVTEDAGTLSCETSGSYQWISCDGNTIIDGETASTFTPTLSGEYAVILTQGTCSDTSDCYSVTASGLGSDKLNQAYKVYPNPAHNFATIDLVNEQTNVTLKVFDMTGNLLKAEELDRLTKMNLDISDYKAGLYMIHIHSDQMNSVARLIKE